VHVSILRGLHPLSWATRFLVWTAPTRLVSGMPVTVTSRHSRTTEASWQKVEEGLELLRTHYPQGFKEVSRHIRRVIVGFLSTSRAAWWGPPRACMLSIEYFSQDSATAADVASSLVHEARHARLERLGFRYTADRRVRLESICTHAEIALAERLPDADSRVGALNAILEQLDSLYSTANLQAGKVHAVGELQAPRWYIRAAQWFWSRAA
jgi:hypothetical protein